MTTTNAIDMMTIGELKNNGYSIRFEKPKHRWFRAPGRWRYVRSSWQKVYIHKKHEYVWREGYWWFDKPMWYWV